MRKSSVGWSTSRAWKRGTGTVTVLETKVHRSSARNAKLAFYVTTIIVGLLTATIEADRMHPILALIVGAGIGALSGAVVWAIVRVWPVIRLIWWWLPEINLGLGLVYGWTALARHAGPQLRLAVVFALIGLPAAVPAVRRRILAWSWCLIVRHRLRTCFAQFITANRSGTLPLILIARPTRVGERVWIYLRPGLSLSDLQTRLDRLAVGCHAATVTVEAASRRNAAYVRIDIKRREVLTGTIGSPLTGLVDPDVAASAPTAVNVPTALDLPDVASTRAMFSPLAPRSGGSTSPRNGNGRKPVPAPASPPADADGDDVTQWI